MGGGYVLNFSNRTFADFIDEHTGRNIDEDCYSGGGGSKANRLRSFWKAESNYVVGKLITALIDYGQEYNAFSDDGNLPDQCRRIAARLSSTTPVEAIDALAVSATPKDFDTLAREVRDAILKNQPEVGLDRLHTFVTKYIRALCEQRGITVSRDKPLHSLFGEYVKRLVSSGEIEAEMTERILKSSISVLEAFNTVRNERSLAHDNAILNYDESLLIFNHVANAIRFLNSVERRLKASPSQPTRETDEDIPF